MEASNEAAKVRTYGNFRRPESPGIGPLGTIGTGVVFAGILGLIVLMTLHQLMVAAVWTILVVIVLSLMIVKDSHGRSGLQRLANRIGWRRTKSRRQHVYRSGVLGRTGWGTFQLPGLLAQTKLTEHHDSYNRPFAVLETPSVGHFSVVIGCEPDGASLVDQHQIDSWVAAWGDWLAALGHELGVVAAAVTVETAPDTGARLRREVTGRIDPNAPELAKTMLGQVMDNYPVGSAQVRAWVSLTFNGRTYAGKKRNADDVARDLAARLPGLTQTLAATGAGPARPVDAQTLCEIVRVAYDPAAAALIDDVHAGGHAPNLSWTDVGPTATETGWDYYRHDGAFSRTWEMTSAPRGEVFSSVLTRLLSPHGEVDRKRVTIIYRPLDSAKAARTVETDKRNADFRIGSSNRPSARAVTSARSAASTAAEEAKGAGLVDFGILITATVTDSDRMPDARAAIDNLAATARLVIRPVYGSQDTAFAACLPLGLVLQSHLRIPVEIRDAM
ncbi:SCO6880 family protein [Aeromicrobium yanjiei]|uniref:SCO6880 family protein n=1 Tax=Aeromicrobium yanjiei TaxID=2662028 RepID=UPI0018909554|nr:SCO6880 family protein [Aeromicrobium yanjiei]